MTGPSKEIPPSRQASEQRLGCKVGSWATNFQLRHRFRWLGSGSPKSCLNCSSCIPVKTTWRLLASSRLQSADQQLTNSSLHGKYCLEPCNSTNLLCSTPTSTQLCSQPTIRQLGAPRNSGPSSCLVVELRKVVEIGSCDLATQRSRFPRTRKQLPSCFCQCFHQLVLSSTTRTEGHQLLH